MLFNAISFITLPIYTRYLTPSDYGIFSLFVTFGMATANLLSLGMRTASFRYYFDYKDKPEEFGKLNSSNFSFTLVILVVAGFIIWFLRDWISISIFKGEIPKELVLLSYFSGCMEYVFGYLTILLSAQTRSRTFTVITTVRVLLNTALSLYFLMFMSMTYMGRIWAVVISQIVANVLLLYFTSSLFRNSFCWVYLKKSLKFCLPQLPLSLMGIAYSTFDRFMLNSYKGVASVGYFDIAEKFANLLKMAMDSISQAWTPFFMDQASLKTEAGKEAIVKRFYEITYFFMFFGLGVTYFSEEMIRFFTTKEFYPAMYVVPVYVYYYVFGIIGFLAANQLMYAEKLISLFPSTLTSIAINIGLNVLLIRHYGAIGAAIATAVAALGASIVQLYFGMKHYPLRVGWLKLCGVFLLNIVFVVPSYLLMMSDTHFIIKLVLKCLLLLLFVFLGMKMKFFPSLKQIRDHGLLYFKSK